MADPAPPNQAQSDPLAVPQPMLKRIALSYRTPVVAGLVALALHAWWFSRCKVDFRPEPVAGFGALLIVLGLLVAARPFIKSGVREVAKQSVQKPTGGIHMQRTGASGHAQALHERLIDEAVPGVIAERVVAVLVIAVGTLVNGYSAPIARFIAFVLGLGSGT